MNKILRNILLLICFIFSIGIASAQGTLIGKASFYANKFDGRTTASGAIFRQNKLTAAHRTLAFGTKVRVTNLENNRTVDVVINDRGPFVNDRIIDLSKRGARELDFIKKGVTKVKVEILYNPDGTNTPAYTQTTTGNTTSKAHVDYYQVAVKSVSPIGFGIQVASYKETANLIKRCDDIKSKTNKNILVQIGKTNGQKVYRIIIGAFSTQEKANDYNKKLKKKFAGSFVVTL